jgi:hypothetical protein
MLATVIPHAPHDDSSREYPVKFDHRSRQEFRVVLSAFVAAQGDLGNCEGLPVSDVNGLDENGCKWISHPFTST